MNDDIIAQRISELREEQPKVFASIEAASEAHFAACRFFHSVDLGFCDQCGWCP